MKKYSDMLQKLREENAKTRKEKKLSPRKRDGEESPEHD